MTTDNSKDKIRDEFSPLLDGELPPEQREAVERELAGDAELLRELETLKRVDALYRGLPQAAAPGDLEARVRHGIEKRAVQFSRRRFAPRALWPMLAAAAMLVVFTLVLTQGVSRINPAVHMAKVAERTASEPAQASAPPARGGEWSMADKASSDEMDRLVTPAPGGGVRVRSTSRQEQRMASDEELYSLSLQDRGEAPEAAKGKTGEPGALGGAEKGSEVGSLEQKFAAATRPEPEPEPKAEPEPTVTQPDRMAMSDQSRGMKEAPVKEFFAYDTQAPQPSAAPAAAAEEAEDVDGDRDTVPSTMASQEALGFTVAPQAMPDSTVGEGLVRGKGAWGSQAGDAVPDSVPPLVPHEQAVAAEPVIMASPPPPAPPPPESLVPPPPAPMIDRVDRETLAKDSPRASVGVDFKAEISPVPEVAAKSSPVSNGAAPENVEEVNQTAAQLLPHVRRIGDRTFTLHDGVWCQEGYDGQKLTVLARDSAELKALFTKDRRLAVILDLPGWVIFKTGGAWYQIMPEPKKPDKADRSD